MITQAWNSTNAKKYDYEILKHQKINNKFTTSNRIMNKHECTCYKEIIDNGIQPIPRNMIKQTWDRTGLKKI